MKAYQDISRSFEERAADLVSRMTLKEKIDQTFYSAPAIERLGVPAWNWSNESAHGVLSTYEAFEATSFPCGLAMGCTWNPQLIEQVGSAISSEARGIHHDICKDGKLGLTFWSPTINIGRDPRWGRNDDEYGEDPVLAGKCAAAYIRGMQGNDPKYLKTVASPKHFACNNSEYNRSVGSSDMDEATLREYYLKVFEIAFKEGGAKSVMSSYNRINGVPASVNRWLLTDVLRKEWGFDGYVVTDFNGISTAYGESRGPMCMGHFYCNNMLEAVSMGLHAGNDLSNGNENDMALERAIELGLADENELDRSLIRLFTARFALGEFDGDVCAYNHMNRKDVCTEAHSDLAVKTANEAVVLLKNNGCLPICADRVKRIAVIGPNAIYRQMGGYSIGSTIADAGQSNACVTAWDGIRSAAEARGIAVTYSKGWNIDKWHGPEMPPMPPMDTDEAVPGSGATGFEDLLTHVAQVNHVSSEIGDDPDWGLKPREQCLQGLRFSSYVSNKYQVEDPDLGKDNDQLLAEAVDNAKRADLVMFIAGTDETTTGEDIDRDNLRLPYDQEAKLRGILAVNPNTVVVAVTSGPVTGEFFDEIPAFVSAIYGGESQGTAIANVLFGDVNPSGKTDQTWYQDEAELPHISQYGIRPNDTSTGLGRTYQYFGGKIRYPFGYGLSYTSFSISGYNIQRTALDANDTLRVSIDVENTGTIAGAEVLQLYTRKRGKNGNRPRKQLKAFKKVFLEPGKKETVAFALPVSDLAFWSNFRSSYHVEPGRYDIMLATSSADSDIHGASVIEVTGEWNAELYHVLLESEKYVYEKGEKSQLTVSATMENARHLRADEFTVRFSTSNSSVALVSQAGIVTACGAGVASITAEVTVDGITKSNHIAIAVKE